jgi:Lrp/AsnC family leucine-responsive transcriptional regulator
LETEKLLDEVNWRILVELQRNGRISHTELGRRVGLTQPAVAERVHRLEEAGVITGYHASVDPTKMGLPVVAIIRLTTWDNACLSRMEIAVRDMREVLECNCTTGVDCYFIKVAVASLQHLEAFVRRLREYGQTTTSIVLSMAVERRPIGSNEYAVEPTYSAD